MRKFILPLVILSTACMGAKKKDDAPHRIYEARMTQAPGYNQVEVKDCKPLKIVNKKHHFVCTKVDSSVK